MKNQIVIDTNLYSVKSTTFGLDWRYPQTTKEHAFERAQWFVNEWAKVGVNATARVYYRDGSTVADFSGSMASEQTIINHIEV